MQSIGDFRKELRDRYKQVKKPRRARVQVLADRVYRELGLDDNFKHYPVVCRLCKQNKEAHINRALSWISDYPAKRNPLGLFMWQLKQIRMGSERGIAKQ